MKTWRCGDCGRDVPKSEDSCGRYLDDYLALRGGSVETAINRAVERAIDPLVRNAMGRLGVLPRIVWYRPRFARQKDWTYGWV